MDVGIGAAISTALDKHVFAPWGKCVSAMSVTFPAATKPAARQLASRYVSAAQSTEFAGTTTLTSASNGAGLPSAVTTACALTTCATAFRQTGGVRLSINSTDL